MSKNVIKKRKIRTSIDTRNSCESCKPHESTDSYIDFISIVFPDNTSIRIKRNVLSLKVIGKVLHCMADNDVAQNALCKTTSQVQHGMEGYLTKYCVSRIRLNCHMSIKNDLLFYLENPTEVSLIFRDKDFEEAIHHFYFADEYEIETWQAYKEKLGTRYLTVRFDNKFMHYRGYTKNKAFHGYGILETATGTGTGWWYNGELVDGCEKIYYGKKGSDKDNRLEFLREYGRGQDMDRQVLSKYFDNITNRRQYSVGCTCELADGEYVQYFDDDAHRIKCKGYYKGGQRHGLFTYFLNINSTKPLLTHTINYKEGSVCGTLTEYFQNKNNRIRSFVNCDNGLRNGQYIEYFDREPLLIKHTVKFINGTEQDLRVERIDDATLLLGFSNQHIHELVDPLRTITQPTTQTSASAGNHIQEITTEQESICDEELLQFLDLPEQDTNNVSDVVNI